MSPDRQGPSTEDHLYDAVAKVQEASISSQIIHLSQVFTGEPNGYFAVNALFVTCRDEIATELHDLLDAAVREFFKAHNLLIDGQHKTVN